MSGTKAILAAALAALCLSASCRVTDGGVRIALVYGISLYSPSSPEGTYPNLTYADDDAAAMATLLSQSGYQVYKRISGQGSTTAALPTRDEILSDIASAVPSGTDRLLVYYSGHGAQYYGSDGELVDAIVPYGAVAADGSFVSSQAITSSELLSALDSSNAASVGLILDSCYSGGFALAGSDSELTPANLYQDTGSVEKAGGSTVTIKGFLDSRSTRTRVLAAAGASEESYDWTDAKQGAFTYFLLISPAYADSNGDGMVTMSEAYSFARNGIETHWNATFKDLGFPEYQFSPHLGGGSTDFALFATKG